MTLQRREFLKGAAASALGLTLGGCAQTGALLDKMHLGPKPLPRWRGFNLTEKFTLRGNKPFVEQDFEMMAGWGFNFARIPMDYRCWQGERREQTLKEIDQCLELGKQYGVHINLNLHRAPGYCINPPEEALNLWKDPKAQEQFAAEWRMFAERYKGIPNARLSFDLVNEPSRCTMDEYVAVIRGAVGAIRAADPARLIMADGHETGTKPIPAVAGLGIWQSTRGYAPGQISHYKASWAGNSQIPPAWPMSWEKKYKDKNTGEEKKTLEVWNRDRLINKQYAPWRELQKQGVNVIVGEFGAYSYTPHEVVLAWMGDNLALWKEYGWGWSLWNLRGTFGILNSHRADVKYEDYKGHQLDRKLLELLRQA